MVPDKTRNLLVAICLQILFNDQCEFPRWSVWFNIAHAVLFMVLFANFYRQAYGKRDKKATEEPTQLHAKHCVDLNCNNVDSGSRKRTNARG